MDARRIHHLEMFCASASNLSVFVWWDAALRCALAWQTSLKRPLILMSWELVYNVLIGFTIDYVFCACCVAVLWLLLSPATNWTSQESVMGTFISLSDQIRSLPFTYLHPMHLPKLEPDECCTAGWQTHAPIDPHTHTHIQTLSIHKRPDKYILSLN